MKGRMQGLVLALGLVPVLAMAQTPVPGSTGPIDRLLARRAELQLSAEQVKQLEAIDARVDAQDRDLVARLEQLGPNLPVGQPMRARALSAEERAQLQATRDERRPLMASLRGLHAGAIAEARGVLNDTQNAQASAYLHPGLGQGQGPRQGMGQGMGPAAGGRGQGNRPCAGGGGRGGRRGG